MMTSSKISELVRENDDLRQLVIRLSTIILNNAVEQRELVRIRGGEMAERLLAAMTPVQFVNRLRETSARCAEYGRNCPDLDAARALEELGVELAVEAESVEALLRSGAGQ